MVFSEFIDELMFNPASNTDRLDGKKNKVFIVHGKKDSVVPVEKMNEWYQQLNEREGIYSFFASLDNIGHDRFPAKKLGMIFEDMEMLGNGRPPIHQCFPDGNLLQESGSATSSLWRRLPWFGRRPAEISFL